MLEQADDHAGITPFIVVPGDQLDEAVVEHDAGGLVENARVRVGDKVLRNDLVARVGENALEGTFACAVNGLADLLISGRSLELCGQVDDGNVSRGNAEAHTGHLALERGDHAADGLRRAGGGGNDVVEHAAARAPVAAAAGIDGLLLARRGMADKFYVASAATSTEEIWNGIGNPVYPPAEAELARHGISCEGKRARQVTRADYAEYDYLIGMDSANIRNMLRIFGGDPDGKVARLLSYVGSERDISDPWYTGEFGTTYNDVLEGCTAFLRYLQQNGRIDT